MSEPGPRILPEGAFNQDGTVKDITGEQMPKGATATIRDLDLCVELDEPTLLIERLLKTAEVMQARSAHSDEWRIVANYAKLASDELRAANEPPAAA